MHTLMVTLAVLFGSLALAMVCRAVHTYSRGHPDQKPWYWLYLLYALAWALISAWHCCEVSEYATGKPEQWRTVVIAAAAALCLLVALLASRAKHALTEPDRKSWWI